jgi:cell division protein FtsL
MVRRKWNLKGVALGAAIAVCAIGTLTFYIWYQTESVKLGLDIGKSEERIGEIEESIEALELRKAALLDLRRVEKIARESLGLIDPADEDLVYLKPDGPR